MNKIIVITGPTGVGKTKLSIILAKKYNGEIINADSMQIYKNLNIGTAKITEEEKQNIKHHLLDIKELDDDYSIYDYQKDCRQAIEEISKKGKMPIIVGGTGLYIKSALYDYNLLYNKNNDNYEKYTNEKLYQELIKIDPKSKNKINKNNRQRIINAINYFNETKNSITENVTEKSLYNCIFIGLTTDRTNLYNIINKRVDKMIENGLIEEVNNLYKKNIHTKPIINGIGYKELYKYFNKETTKEEAIELIKKNSRHYAKRQYTFLNNKLPVKWFNTDYTNFDKTANEVIKYIDSNK